jgi:DNA-binding transcriptional MerR regulator
MKEFAKYTGFSQTNLRYYDEIGLLKPVKRGENNYRYYSAQQIVTINMINVLRSLGTPLNEIAELESNRTPELILDQLKRQERKLTAELRRIYEAQSVIHIYSDMIEAGLHINEDKVIEYEAEDMPIVLGPKTDFEDNKPFYEAFLEFCERMKQLGLNLSYPVGGYYDSMDYFLEHPSQPSRFFLGDPKGGFHKMAGRYLRAYTRGYYGVLNDVPTRIADYAKEHSLDIVGPVYVIYLHDELSVKDPDQYLSRASVLIKK